MASYMTRGGGAPSAHVLGFYHCLAFCRVSPSMIVSYDDQGMLRSLTGHFAVVTAELFGLDSDGYCCRLSAEEHSESHPHQLSGGC